MYRLHILDGVDDIQPVVRAFWTTFHWTLHYFRTNEVLNWDWVYPYTEAPLIQHVLKFSETECESCERTFGITRQLQFILPSRSIRNAKKLMKFPDEIYAETRHPWMKRHDWESDPRISLPWSTLSEIVPL
jgi:5'-3' exonuclease